MLVIRQLWKSRVWFTSSHLVVSYMNLVSRVKKNLDVGLILPHFFNRLKPSGAWLMKTDTRNDKIVKRLSFWTLMTLVFLWTRQGKGFYFYNFKIQDISWTSESWNKGVGKSVTWSKANSCSCVHSKQDLIGWIWLRFLNYCQKRLPNPLGAAMRTLYWQQVNLHISIHIWSWPKATMLTNKLSARLNSAKSCNVFTGLVRPWVVNPFTLTIH